MTHQQLHRAQIVVSEDARIDVSVIVPCHNEEACVAPLVEAVTSVCRTCTQDYEIVLVDDGSQDGTWQAIQRASGADGHVVGIRLARNFGQQNALTVGLQFCRGDHAFILDADLQDPPEALPDMLRIAGTGYDVVYGLRTDREGESPVKLATAKVFYKLLKWVSDAEIPADVGDFRLMNRRMIDTLNALPEHHRFLRGLCAWVGFRQCAYPYARRPRASGNSSYTFRSMGRLAIDAITGFSIAPLRLGVVMSGISAMFGVLAALYATYSYVALNAVPGWASTVMLLAFFSSMQLLTLGIIGEYVGRIFMVLKGRPHAIVASVVGLEVDPHAPKGRILFPPTAGD